MVKFDISDPKLAPTLEKQVCMITLCQMASNAEYSNMTTTMVVDLEQKLRNVQVGLIV